MTQDNSKEPLYKVLKDKTTPGEWVIEDNGAVVSQDLRGLILCSFNDRPEWTANKEYTVMAKNNLHHLAEALDEVLKEYEYACKNMAALNGMQWSENSVSIKAKEALKRIS